MAFKQTEKKAKKYVREELEVYNPSDLSVEEQIKLAQDEFNKLMVTEQTNMQRIETEVPMVGKSAALQHKLIHLYVSGQYTNSQIAKILNVTYGTVMKWLRLPEIKELIVKYQEEEDTIVNSALKALRMKAIQKASELLDADNEMVQSIMVRDVLDRTGHKAVERKIVDHNITYEQRIQMLLNGDDENEIKDVDYSINDDNSINGEQPNGKINTEGDVSK